MDSPKLQAQIKWLIYQLQEKQLEIESARQMDVVFKERKKLFLELKDLNEHLQECLEKSNLQPIEVTSK